MQTHKGTLFISAFVKAGHPRRAEKEKNTNVMASCKPKITRRPLWPRVRVQTPKPHFSSSSQSAHQLTDYMSGLAKVTPVCTRSLSFLLHFSVLSAWTEKKNDWVVCLFVCLFFSYCHVRMKSSSWNTGIFFSDLKIFNYVMLKELMWAQHRRNSTWISYWQTSSPSLAPKKAQEPFWEDSKA